MDIGRIGEIRRVPVQLAHEFGFKGGRCQFRPDQHLMPHRGVLMETGHLGSQPADSDHDQQAARKRDFTSNPPGALFARELVKVLPMIVPEQAGERHAGEAAQDELRTCPLGR